MGALAHIMNNPFVGYCPAVLRAGAVPGRLNQLAALYCFRPAAFKKAPQELSAFLCTGPCKYTGPVTIVLGKQIDNAAAGTGVLFPGAVDQLRNSGIDDGPGAHGTWFQRDIERAAIQTPVSTGSAGFAYGF